MKKIALCILSVFMILGGVLLTVGCEKKISLSVSTEEVVIYTNDETAENHLEKEIQVNLENSSAGVVLEVLSGSDCVRVSSARKKGDSYAFTIYGDKSGQAEIKVSAIEDSKQFKVINVVVNTILERIETNGDDSVNARTKLFVVKGIKKKLNVEDFFKLYPITANVKNVTWQFEDGTTEFRPTGELFASIEGDWLTVYDLETNTLPNITVQAVFTLNDKVENKVKLEVLESSTINSLKMEDVLHGEQILIENNAPVSSGASFDLKRNNAKYSEVKGRLVVNTKYDVTLTPVVLSKNNDGTSIELERDEYERFFSFDVTSKNQLTNQVAYEFSLNAIDRFGVKEFGEFEFFLKVGYKNYDVDLTTENVKVDIASSYAVERTEIFDSQNNPLNNDTVDVFSNYSNGNGFEINTLLQPDDVALDNSWFRLSIDLDQSPALQNFLASLPNEAKSDFVSAIASFSSKGNPLTFQPAFESGGSVYISNLIKSGESIFVKASSYISGVLEGVTFEFVPVSDPFKKTNLTFNFYKISQEQNLKISEEDGKELTTKFISSNKVTNNLTYRVRIDGLSSLNGLQLKSDANSHFVFSELEIDKELSGVDFIIVEFSVSLSGRDFEDSTHFWFEHVTGKKSSPFEIEAFMPLTSVSVKNGNLQASGVFINQDCVQDFIEENGSIVHNANLQSESLAKLMLEAGTSLPLLTNFQSLSSEVSFLFLPFVKMDVLTDAKSFVDVVAEIEGLNTEDGSASAFANELFKDGSRVVEYIARYYYNFRNYFRIVPSAIMTQLNENRLTLTDNQFKGFVLAKFNGFDEDHKEVVVVRLFALESFNSVKGLTSNIKEKLLYTTETLSQNDMERSYVDVTISFRNDDKTPTYTNSLSYFTFNSGKDVLSQEGLVMRNRFYDITDIQSAQNGKFLKFRITARSTNQQTVIHDILTIIYMDQYGYTRKEEIQIEIRNVERVESVKWVNATQDRQIYLNLTSKKTEDKNFTIATSVMPGDANDMGLSYQYFASGMANALNIQTNSVGQSFNLSIGNDLTEGGNGFLYLLPNDMVKNRNGVNQILLYSYQTDDDGNLLYDENGFALEEVVYMPLTQLDRFYDVVVNGGTYNNQQVSNFFLNNDGQKIYNSSIILKIAITIADGKSEGTAIRIYNEQGLKEIDTALYYRIMNNLTLTNWKVFDNLRGMIFGDSDMITLKFQGDSENFVNRLDGTVKDLVFTGKVNSTNQYSGFVANINNGTLDNVSVDIYYDSVSKNYKSSTLSSETGTAGGLVGQNNGQILNCFSFGATIDSSATYAGGIVGENNGKIENCGVEFYNFKSSDHEKAEPNKIIVGGNGVIGGLVGVAGNGSQILKSYAYAYPLTETGSVDTIFKNAEISALFIGSLQKNPSVTVQESFAFLGDLQVSFNGTGIISFENSYFVYENGNSMKFLTNNGLNGATLTNSDLPSDTQISGSTLWQETKRILSTNPVWEAENIDKNVNFGFMYLKNVAQSAQVSVDGLSINSNATDPLKFLKVSDSEGVLFVYKPVVEINNEAEQSDLDKLNTISLAELFGVTSKQARSLLVSAATTKLAISTTSIKVLKKEAAAFEFTVYSKMNLAKQKTFKFIILNNLPELATTIDEVEFFDGQTIMLQKGKDLTITHVLSNSIYLNGKAYQTTEDDYSIDFTLNGETVSSDAFMTIQKSNSALVLTGVASHEEDVSSQVVSYISVSGLESDLANFNDAIKQIRTRSFKTFVYNGATSLLLDNAKKLNFLPSEFASFDVLMASDNAKDNLVFILKHGDLRWTSSLDENATSAVFDLTSNIKIEVTWNYIFEKGLKRFTVNVFVADECKFVVDQDYNFEIEVRPLSQIDDASFARTVSLTLKTQPVDKISINTYAIDSRRIVGSTLFLRPSSKVINTLMPASDAILSVSVRPEFSLMTHFTVEYEVLNAQTSGTLSISRLSLNSNYGFFVNSLRTSMIDRGLKINLSDDDRKGNGDYYFRIYASSLFAVNSEIRLKVTYFNGDQVLDYALHDLSIDFLQEATVKVNGVSSYLLAKGESAEVSVSVGLDQTVSNLYLQNQGTGLVLTSMTEEIVGSRKIYTANLIARVNANVVLASGEKGSSGEFLVCASVERMINGVKEIKVSRAVVDLVDFTLDESGISVQASGDTTTFNGKTYDVLYTYIGATTNLNFNYPLRPESYDYDVSDSSEIAAVQRIIEERNKFALKNTYKNEDVNYYINYDFDINTGLYNELTLKEQLYYCRNEEDITAIYSPVYDEIRSDDLFSIEEEQVGNTGNSQLLITGKTTGKRLMKLETTILHQGQTVKVIPYYFVIEVDIWTDEETPTQITSGAEFVKFATSSEKPDDYILMNDIVLENYTPLNTNLIKSLDGNGFVIHLNSFAMPTGTNNLNLALFSTVEEGTTLKNVKVNLYNGGQISVNVSDFTRINIAGFAVENNGVIYNCEVVSYYSALQKTVVTGDTGLVVKYIRGQNTNPIEIEAGENLESKVAGFVIENKASIVNSRVGGESLKYIQDIAGQNYINAQKLGTFTVEGQGEVAGFIVANSGALSACFADNVQINNKMNSNTSLTAGFALYNYSNIHASYVEGVPNGDVGKDKKVQNNLSNISARGVVAGFVYSNTGFIKNSYANIAIENVKTKPAFVSGFVYRNETGGEITLCLTMCEIVKSDSNQMPFTGVDGGGNSLNLGKISFSYFHNVTKFDDTNESKLSSGVTPVEDLIYDPENALYGFSFASSSKSYDGIWQKTDNGVSLVSANRIAFSNRYAVFDENTKLTYIFYNKSIRDANTLLNVDLSYGGENNPIIIRSAYDFAVATGAATSKEISSYKEFYNSREVFGNYRIVNNIDFNDENVDQNADSEGKAKLKTTEKTFSGLLDGNGFTISNIMLTSMKEVENFGLFAKFDKAVVMNLDLIVDFVNNSQANVVGTLAGTAVDSRILSITLMPVSGQDQNTSIQGKNVVGGVVGMLFGDSKMHDITVTNIKVYSSHYDNSKNINSNNSTISSLRGKVQAGNSIQNETAKLSYAGAIAGYVDVYDSTNNETVKYIPSMKVSEYDLVTIHVKDSVDIYGEIVGGLFGYVGDSTYVYDASLELDANMNLSSPSYIISKNLYAGGLIGENKGGLFAVYASYETSQENSLQQQIEDGMHGYYAGSTGVEKGQQSIFSYTNKDAGFVDQYDDPLYIGGLVGYMTGGYINVGYNKLNVIGHSDTTKAVGGIIGLAGRGNNSFEISNVSGSPNVDIYLKDVYASGDLYVDGKNGCSGGIVGALYDSNPASIAFMNVLAMNYYSYDTGRLSGDASITTQSDRHFVLIGKDGIDHNEQTLKSNVYLINSVYASWNVFTKSSSGTIDRGSFTVGGYNKVQINDLTIELKPFGFSMELADTENSRFLFAEHVGNSVMTSNSAIYVRFSKYFIENGWDNQYWHHEQDHAFPEIKLLPTTDTYFWDAHNTATILGLMAGGNGVTIVVRGKSTQAENDKACEDIDLTTYIDDKGNGFKEIDEFGGTLVSYEEYLGIKGEYELKDGDNLKDGGGEAGDAPGIIINKTMFKKFRDSNVTIKGVTFYFKVAEDKQQIDYTLIDEEVNKGVFDGIKLVYNNNVSMETKNVSKSDTNPDMKAGLIVSTAQSTSFVNISVVMRGETTITFNNHGSNEDGIVDIGLLAGSINQANSFTSINIEGIEVNRGKTKNNLKAIEINLFMGRYKTFNFGLYAGRISRTSTGTSKITIGLQKLDNINVNLLKDLDSVNSKNSEVFVGGFVGQISGADKISLLESEVSQESRGISIRQHKDLSTLYAGLAFGKIDGSDLTMASETDNTKLIGSVYQVNSETTEGDILKVETKRSFIGGIAGYVNSTVTISNLSIDFSVGSMVGDKEIPSYSVGENQTVFDVASYDFSTSLSPYLTGSDLAEDSIGGMFGYAAGATIRISGANNLEGFIDLQAKGKIYVGGLIGRTTGSVETALSSTNSMNISINQEKTAAARDVEAEKVFVGGLIGYVQKVTGTSGTELPKYKISMNEGTTAYANFTGTVLSSVKELVFGGAIGCVDRTDYFDSEQKVAISNVAFGGAVKVYGENINGGKLTVGGVVGKFEAGQTVEEVSEYAYKISNALVYGDVFVNYMPYKKTSASAGEYLNHKLADYNFGGIVGSASYVNIKNCASLMTSFNNRLSTGQSISTDATAGGYFVGAIVGANSNLVKFEENIYSSGVNMAYQTEDGNTDLAYGNGSNQPYYGYTNQVKLDNSTNVNYEPTTADILSRFAQFVPTSQSYGIKLNPYRWSNTETSDIKEETDGTHVGTLTLTPSHNVSWISVLEDLNRSRPFANDNLSSVAFVGNGHTLTLSDNRRLKPEDEQAQNHPKTIGAFANSMGKEFVVNTGSNEDPVSRNKPNFTLVSSFVLNLHVENVDIKTEEGKSFAYGGIAGKTFGNSFIYGVGVKGTLSVGGENNQLQLAGLVGEFNDGFVNECYVDANIAYRAAEEGVVSAIANVLNGNTTIKSTYASGLLETYVNVPIYTFASSNKDVGETSNTLKNSNDLFDCYSISQTKRTILTNSSGNAVTGNAATVNFVNYEAIASTKEGEIVYSYKIDTKHFNKFGQLINGCYDVTTFDITSIEEMSLNYGDSGKIRQSYSMQGAKDETAVSSDAEGATWTPWYFSPYVNYGYASHGFGYLKNVTSYTRTVVNEDEIKAETAIVPEYEYSPITYDSVLKLNEEMFVEVTEGTQDLVFLGVPNAGKLKQMIETVDTAGNNDYKVNYRFVLRYGFDMSKSDNEMFAKNIGYIGREFILDGNNNTLDFSSMPEAGIESMFDNVVGTIENLRLNNIKATGKGTLANVVTGKLSNITVVGELNTSSSIAGGVVGELRGEGVALQSVVNSTTECGILGGIVGELSESVKDAKDGSLTYSSNAGQVINKVSTNNKEVVVKVNLVDKDKKPTSNEEVRYVTGGLVGHLISGAKVENSYNANAVLNAYSNDKCDNNANNKMNRFISGGIVGYSEGSILNCFNTGLVGAGNYASTGFSFAGGIFGYGTSSTKAINCINDGQVEAINKLPTESKDRYNIAFGPLKIATKNGSTWSLSSEIEAGHEWNSKPANVGIEVTMTYNPGKNREVYAYGIGFIGVNPSDANSGTREANIDRIIGCKSSLDNIKNDGCVGQVVDKQIMVYDRETMLDNYEINGVAQYEGKFALNKTVNVNGYDSYGIPARIFMTDTMTRRLNPESVIANDIKKRATTGDAYYYDIWYRERRAGQAFSLVGNYKNGKQESITKINNLFTEEIWDYGHWNTDQNASNEYYNKAYDVPNKKQDKVLNKSLYDLYGTTTANHLSNITIRDEYKGLEVKNRYNDPYNFNNLVANDNADQVNMAASEDKAYYLAADTTYYSSVRFAEYDAILKGEAFVADFGLFAFDMNKDVKNRKIDNAEYNRMTVAFDEKIERKIAAIDEKLSAASENVEVFNVNGVQVGVAKSKNNLQAIISPNYVDFEVSIEIGDNIDKSFVNENNIEIFVNDGNLKYQFKILEELKFENGKLLVKGRLYFDASVKGSVNIKVGFNYETSVSNFEIAKNNVHIIGNQAVFDLTSMQTKIVRGTPEADEIKADTITKIEIEGEDCVIFNKDVDTLSFDSDFENFMASETATAMLKTMFEDNLSGLDGKRLKFTYQVSVIGDNEHIADIHVDSTNGKGSAITIETENATFKTYKTISMTTSFEQLMSNFVIGQKIDLSQFNNVAGVTINVGDYVFTYSDESGWSVTEPSYLDGLILELDATGELCIFKAIEKEGTEVKFDPATDVDPGNQILQDFRDSFNISTGTTSAFDAILQEVRVGQKVDLSTLKNASNGKLALGDSEYAFNFSTLTGWRISKQPSTDNLNFSFNGDVLEIKGNLQAVQNFINQHFTKFEAYCNKSQAELESEESFEATQWEYDFGGFGKIRSSVRSAPNERFTIEGNKAKYSSSVFALENESGVVKNSESHYGMEFYEVVAPFKWDAGTSLYVNEIYGYSVYLNDNKDVKGNLIPIKVGRGKGYGSDGVILQNFDIKKLEVTANKVLYSLDGNIVENYSISSINISKVKKDDKTVASYSVEKEKAGVVKDMGDGTVVISNCPYCGKDHDRVTTSMHYDKTVGLISTVFGYYFNIYDCGAIEVIYHKIDYQGAVKFKKFVLKDNEITSYVYQSDKDNRDLEWNTIEWKLDNEANMNMENFKNYDLRYGLLNVYSEVINIDLVVADFDENGIYLLNYDPESKETFQQAIQIPVNGYQEESKDMMIYSGSDEIYDGFEDKEGLKISEDCIIWREPQPDEKFEADSFNSKTYYYKYNKNKIGVKNNANVTTANDENIDLILLDRDIGIGIKPLGDISKDIFGKNNNVLKFASSDSSMNGIFSVINSNLSNFVLSGQVSAHYDGQGSENYAYLLGKTLSSGKSVENVQVFGNIRNVSALGVTAGSTIMNNAGSVSDSNLKSSVSITGLDAGNGQNVSSKLNGTVSASNDILIAGNAIKGRNGEDGTAQNRRGQNASSGGEGGKIENQAFAKFVRAGQNSIGGFGGNGANGCFNETKLISFGGGGGGAAGESQLNSVSVNINRKNLDGIQFGGNGGVGGLGRFVGKNERMYLSAGGGAAGTVGLAGSNGSDCSSSLNTSKRNQNENQKFMMGVVAPGGNDSKYSSEMEDGGYRYDTNVTIRGNAYNNWVQSWKGGKNGKYPYVNTAVGGAAGRLMQGEKELKEYAGGRPELTQTYMRGYITFSSLEKTCSANFKHWGFNYTIFAWTSGETVNSGGSFGNSLGNKAA